MEENIQHKLDTLIKQNKVGHDIILLCVFMLISIEHNESFGNVCPSQLHFAGAELLTGISGR